MPTTGEPPARRWYRCAAATMLAFVLLATSCSVDQPVMEEMSRPIDPGREATGSGSGTTAPPVMADEAAGPGGITCALPGDGGTSTGLTPAGEVMFERHARTGAVIPTYRLAVDIDPTTGTVDGAMRATIATQPGPSNFRIFAGLESFDARLEVTDVTVDGQAVEATVDQALLSLPATTGDGPTTTVGASFRFTIAQMAANESLLGALSGETLQPDHVGLLGRTHNGMQLGHWFPIWLPDGVRSDPDPAGFGDIGAFPAASICATISVPPGFEVITSGVRVASNATSVVDAASGLRDFSIVVSDDLAVRTARVDGVAVRVWGPAANPGQIETVLQHAVASQEALVGAFGPYPWSELDLVSTPLGGGVAGMEWPGMVWFERSMFAGGLPGLGDMNSLFDDEISSEMLAEFGGDALTTSLEWTVAHELGHEWWHAVVGNDSIASPSVDEPLAQFAACLAMQRLHPENWREVCEAQTVDQYGLARALGIDDAVAEQPSDRFESSLQYGAIIYGKAPGFYFAVADLIGWPTLTAALQTFIASHSFDLVSTDTLRTHLVAAGGDDHGEAVGALWDRWFRGTTGDDDIDTSARLGGLEAIEGLEDIELDELLQAMEELGLGDVLTESGLDPELFAELMDDLLDTDSAN